MSSPDPSLDLPQGRILVRPASHLEVRRPHIGIDRLIGDGSKFLLRLDSTRPNMKAITMSTVTQKPQRVQARTYNSQLRITRCQLLGMPCLGRLALQSLVSPSNPALRRLLSEIDLLSFVSARVSIEQDPSCSSAWLPSTVQFLSRLTAVTRLFPALPGRRARMGPAYQLHS